MKRTSKTNKEKYGGSLTVGRQKMVNACIEDGVFKNSFYPFRSYVLVLSPNTYVVSSTE